MFARLATIAALALIATLGAVGAADAHQFHSAQEIDLDAAGDADGTYEVVYVNGERITEISIRFDCETMGNASC